MKISLKNNYNKNELYFDNKDEMINYIKNYIEERIGKPVNKNNSIYELKKEYFTDYEIVK